MEVQRNKLILGFVLQINYAQQPYIILQKFKFLILNKISFVQFPESRLNTSHFFKITRFLSLWYPGVAILNIVLTNAAHYFGYHKTQRKKIFLISFFFSPTKKNASGSCIQNTSNPIKRAFSEMREKILIFEKGLFIFCKRKTSFSDLFFL